MAWIENGPVSLPPPRVVFGAGLAITLIALVGAGLGFSTGWRGGGRPELGAIDQSQDTDQAIVAKPIVEIPSAVQQAATNAAVNSAASQADASNEIAARTAAVEAVQSKPSQGNIDDILTSSSERPQAPAKPSTDEDAPGGPAKSDVPF